LQPLVSIIVTTYNAAKFVVETLESAKAQSYQPIELIISDDCSTDNTIELCTKWLQENKHHFTHTAIITVPINTGVSANCNRCIQAANANWIKLIAGDDILLPNCIADNMQFVQTNVDAAIVFSKVMLYNNNFEQQNYLVTYPDPYPMNIMDPHFTAAHQYQQLLLSDRINYTPSSFFNKQAIINVGGFDEENKLMEDYPMWLKLTKANIKLSYFDIPTVGYRRHQAAANNMQNNTLFKPLYLMSGPFLQKSVYPFLPWDIASSKQFVLITAKLFNAIGLNKKTTINKKLFNPFHYIVTFKKKVLKMGKNNLLYADNKNNLGA
jgi:glycosyltransferase involved in cell wall biosynthesis